MTLQLQILLIIGSLLFFYFLVHFIRKAKLSTEHAVLWVLWGLGVIVIAIFPQIIYTITQFLGFMAPISAIFLMMIFLLYTLVFYLFLKLSVLEDKLKNLAHEVALLKKDMKNERK